VYDKEFFALILSWTKVKFFDSITRNRRDQTTTIPC
jgi:uncharacterized protein YifN (PemK superfamily)